MRLVLLTFAIAAALWPAPAPAQEYPSRPVLFVVPYAAGGGTETMARLLGRRLEQRLGKPFVIDNRPGAGTAIGATFVAKSAPDGHTILLATSTTMAINVSIYSNLSYDPIKDLVPVALFSDIPFVLVVNPALPVHSVAELVDARQAHARRARLCLERARWRRPSLRRALEEHDRHRDDARALQGACARLQRRGRRPCAADVRGFRNGAAADQGRPAARARRDDRATRRRRSRNSAAVAGRPARLCRFILADGGGAGGNPQADPAQAQWGVARHPGRARRSRRILPTAASFRS